MRPRSRCRSLPSVISTPLLLAITLLIVPSCDRGSPYPSPENFLLVTVDCLRADRLGVFGWPDGLTPNMDRLAREGVTFAQCIAPSSWTTPSLPSLITGTHAHTHGLDFFRRELDPSLETLGSVLADAGLKTAFYITSVPRLKGIEKGFNRPKRFEVPSPDSVAVAEALRWLKRRRDQPWFLWVHILAPHTPYEYHPPHSGSHAEPFGSAADSLLDFVHKYEDEIRHSDKLLGDLLAMVDARVM